MGDVVLSISVSKDSDYVATGSKSFIKIWLIEDMGLVKCYNLTEDSDVFTVAWNPAMNILAVGCGNIISIRNPMVDVDIDKQMLNWWQEYAHTQDKEN